MALQMRKNRTITIMAIVITAMLGFFSTNCKKIEPERLIIVKTGAVTDVTQTTCVVTASLFDVGGPSGVSQHGFCYSFTPKLADIIDCTRLGAKSTKYEYKNTKILSNIPK